MDSTVRCVTISSFDVQSAHIAPHILHCRLIIMSTSTDRKVTPNCIECNQIYSEIQCIDCNKHLCAWCNSKIHQPIGYRNHEIIQLYDVHQPWMNHSVPVIHTTVTPDKQHSLNKHVDILTIHSTPLSSVVENEMD